MTRPTSTMVRLLAVASMAVMLTACGSQSAASPSAAGPSAAAPSTAASGPATSDAAPSAAALSGSLNIAYWNYGPAAEAGNKAIADGFMAANPGVAVTLTPVAGENWGTYYANLATLIASGQTPDMAFTASEGIKFLAENGLVVPVNSYLDAESGDLKGDIAPALLQSFGFQGEITAIPNGWNNMVVYYNKKLFQDAGLPEPTADWDWAKFKETAKALSKDTDGDGKTDQYGFAWAGNEIFPGILPWVTNAGGNLVNDDVSAPTANSPEVTEAVTFLKGLIDEGIAAAPSPMSDIFTAFQNGKLAMFGGGRWPSATFLGNGFTDWDIQLYPTGTTYRTVAGAAGYAILTSAKSPDLAWALQKYTVSPEVQDAQIGTPDKPRDSIPTLRSTAEKTVTAGIPPDHGDLFYGSVDNYPTLVPFPAPAKYSEYEATVLRHLQLIFSGEVSVKDGLDAMQKDLSTIIGG